MSNLRNRVQLIGHLGQDPEIKVFENTKLARFSVATNESYKDKDGQWQEETTWHNITAWGPIAERAEQFLKKGSHVMIEGKLVNREYTNEQNEKKYITEVRTRNFLLLDKKENDGNYSPNKNSSSSSQINTSAKGIVQEDEDILPF